MMKIKYGTFALVVLLLFACKKPTENLKIVVDTDIIKYTALIHVSDAASGAVPPGLTMTVGGAGAANIYELSGKKSFNISSGIITIGPGPSAVPAAGSPVTCTVQLSAPGYNSITQSITFTAGQMQQVVNLYLAKAGTNPPPPPVVNPPVYNPVSLNFIGRCSNRNDLEIRPSVYVFFRETGSNAAYQYLGYMNKGFISTNLLAQGKTYDFQIAFNGETYQSSQKIEQASYTVSIDMGSSCNNF